MVPKDRVKEQERKETTDGQSEGWRERARDETNEVRSEGVKGRGGKRDEGVKVQSEKKNKSWRTVSNEEG